MKRLPFCNPGKTALSKKKKQYFQQKNNIVQQLSEVTS